MCENPKNIWTPDNYIEDEEVQPRGLYRTDLSLQDYDVPKEVEFVGLTTQPAKIARAVLAGNPPNLIGSKLHFNEEELPWKKGSEYHAPMLDLDTGVRLKKSSTRNHYHVLFERAVEKKQYEKALEAMSQAAIVQYGWIESMDKYGQTFLRWNALKDEPVS